VHVISQKCLKAFWAVHKQAEEPLRAWYRTLRKLRPRGFGDLCSRFPAADQVGPHTVFNIGGNKFRLVVKIEYGRGKVYVHPVMTHREYDLGKWKNG
jgi:mRNA interferase HigB